MPGITDSYFYVAFQLDDRGQAVPAFEPRQARTRQEAIGAAEALASDHAGTVAWSRHAEPAIGELGPPVVVFRSGKVGDFD